MARRRVGKRLLLGAALACLQLGVLGVATAWASAPTVTLTRYSPTVTGNIGSATAGVHVTVSLVRAGTTVDTAPTVTTTSGGDWTATFPSRVVGDDFDIVDVAYSGTGAPPNASYGTPNATALVYGFPFVDEAASIAGAGSSGGFSCETYLPTPGCAAPVANVAYAAGGSAAVTGTANLNYSGVWNFAFSPAVGPNDAVTVTESYAESNGSTLILIQPAPMPGAGADVTAGYPYGAASPTCSADLVTAEVTCGPLAVGSYDLVQHRGVATLGTQTAAVSTAGASASYQLSSAQPGDTVTLNVHGAGGRTITTLHVSALRLDEQQAAVDGSPAVVGGSCQPLEWFFVAWQPQINPGPLCPSSGDASAGVPASLDDETSGGTTKLTLPSIIVDTSPVSGESVTGSSIVAFADLQGGATTPMSLSISPIGGGTTPGVTGDPNSATGATVTGLTAGKRYTATWVETDSHGDTNTVSTIFVDQSGASASPGPQGPQGPAGRRGPRGYGWRPIRVCVRSRRGSVAHATSKSATITTCQREWIEPGVNIRRVKAKLTQGRIVYAVGHATRVVWGTRVVLHNRTRISPGTYTLTVVMVTPHSTITVRSQIAIP